MINFTFLSFIFLAGEFPISTASGRQWKPAVAFGGEKYLVIWEDTRKTGDIFNNDIWGQFVSKEGTLVDTNFPICTADSGQWEIDIASGDSNYLVVWRDLGSRDIWGRLVSPEGMFVNTAFPICSTNYCSWEPSVIWGNRHWLVVWVENYNDDSSKVWGQFILHDGSIEGPRFPLSTEKKMSSDPVGAFDGINFLVVWNRLAAVYGQIVDSTGVLIDTRFLVLEEKSHRRYPDIASNGINYLVVEVFDHADNDTIVGQLVSLDDSLIGTPILLAAEPQTTRWLPVVAWDGTNYLVVWEDFRNGDRDVYGQWVSPSGELIDTNFAIIKHPAPQDPPRIAGDSEDNCLVVWCDGRGDAFDIYGRIISGTGIEEQEARIGKQEVRVYPNPFNQLSVISYQVAVKSKVSLRIYDLSGRLVESLVDKELNPGYYNTKWNAGSIPGGIYFLKLERENDVKIKKLIKTGVKL